MRAACRNEWQDGIGSNHVRWVVLAAVLGGLPLGGCTEKPDNRMCKQNIAFAKVDAKPEKSRSVLENSPRPVQTSARPADPRLPAPTVLEISDVSTTNLDPSTLVGLAPPAIDRILGKPSGTRTEAMAVQWTYNGVGNGAGCWLEIFFYPDIVNGDLRALKYSIANKKGEAGGGGNCAGSLMMARSDGSD
jgi:hypothetical protein